MKANGNGFLKVTGILEIIFGAAAVAFTLWALAKHPAEFQVYGRNAADVMWAQILIYAAAAVQIIAGIVGVVCSNDLKKANLCLVFSMILLAVQFSYFGSGNIVANIISLIVPFLYCYGAVQNQKQYRAEKMQ